MTLDSLKNEDTNIEIVEANSAAHWTDIMKLVTFTKYNQQSFCWSDVIVMCLWQLELLVLLCNSVKVQQLVLFSWDSLIVSDARDSLSNLSILRIQWQLEESYTQDKM